MGPQLAQLDKEALKWLEAQNKPAALRILLRGSVADLKAKVRRSKAR